MSLDAVKSDRIIAGLLAYVESYMLKGVLRQG